MKNIIIEEELEGYEAFLVGVPKGDNPYGDNGTRLAEDSWFTGWEKGWVEKNCK